MKAVLNQPRSGQVNATTANKELIRKPLHSPEILASMNNGFPPTIQTTGNSMRISFAFLFLLIVRPTGDGLPRRDTYVLHLQKGDEFYRAFDNEKALVQYQKAYAAAPDSFATIERLVSIYSDMGRLKLHKDDSSEVFYRKSLAYADSLQKRFPERAETHFWLALSEGSMIPFLSTKQKVVTAGRVMREANRAIEIDSGFALAYVVLGIFQREASKISWFERLIANVVFGADFSGSLEASETFLRKSVSLDSTNSYGYYELYWTYKAMKDSANAVQSLQKLMTIPPTNAREQQQRVSAMRQLALFAKKD
jgi:tetratricopeptide (TPR) repeat protein